VKGIGHIILGYEGQFNAWFSLVPLMLKGKLGCILATIGKPDEGDFLKVIS
jgi:hypothetical protein